MGSFSLPEGIVLLHQTVFGCVYLASTAGNLNPLRFLAQIRFFPAVVIAGTKK